MFFQRNSKVFWHLLLCKDTEFRVLRVREEPNRKDNLPRISLPSFRPVRPFAVLIELALLTVLFIRITAIMDIAELTNSDGMLLFHDFLELFKLFFSSEALHTPSGESER